MKGIFKSHSQETIIKNMESKAVGIILVSLVLISEIHLLLAMKSYNISPEVLDIYEIRISSHIDGHYARTTIVKKLENKAEIEQNITYSVVFPEEAYITEFIIEADGKNHTAHVTAKTEDKNNQTSKIPNQPKGITERDSNSFILPINVKPLTKMAFYLKYEQLLERRNSLYEHAINIHTDQTTPYFDIEVVIDEKSNLVYLDAVTRICKEDTCKDIPVKNDEISKYSNNKVIVRPNLNIQEQVHFMEYLDSNGSRLGFTGQFIVKYEVHRNLASGQILTKDGYCVHFFAPSELPPISKYVVFILDTSASMQLYNRLILLKDAMYKILEKLHHNDLFSIVEFNYAVKVWDLDGGDVYYPSKIVNSLPIKEKDFKNFAFPKARQVNEENIKKAKQIISAFQANERTNIYSALRVGLHLSELAQEQMNNNNSFIVLLTDGEPTTPGHITKEEVVEEITKFNVGLRKSSIFTLSFGPDPDYYFLEKLAVRNGGFTKNIYDGQDASQQLQDFYKLISTPIMTNITFQYGGSVTDLTITEFTTMFNGSELAVAGRCDNPPNATIEGIGANGKITFKNPEISKTNTDVKRIWTYLSITQLLERANVETDRQSELFVKAYYLAFNNAFTTYVTSLVVPDLNNGTIVVNPETSRKGKRAAVSLPGITPPPFIPKEERLPSTTPPPLIPKEESLPSTMPPPLLIPKGQGSGCSSWVLFSFHLWFSSMIYMVLINGLVF